MIKNLMMKWLGERFEIDKMEKPVKEQLFKRLPKNISWAHTLGSMSLFLFISQIITGILLLVYYRPTVDEAFDSVQFITTQAYMGWLCRQIHAWGANLMIIVVFFHMLRTFISGSFKKPREITWILGIFIFFITLVFGFTGYLLPWNQLAYWATTVGTEIAGAIPFVGEWIMVLLRGGPTVNEETLSRFFVVHVIVLPWVLFFLVVIHLFFVRLQGMSTLDNVGEEKEENIKGGLPFFPHHILKEGIILFLLLGVLVTLSILAPFELGEKANPLETPHAVKPEWYFLPMYHVLKYFPKLVGIFVVLLGPIFLIIWPFIDRNRFRHPLKRKISVTIGILAVIGSLILGFMGHYSETEKDIFGKTYQFDIYGIPHLKTSAEHKLTH